MPQTLAYHQIFFITESRTEKNNLLKPREYCECHRSIMKRCFWW